MRGQISLDEALAIARRGRIFTGNHSSDLHECEQDGCDGRDLNGAQSHKIDKQLYESALLRDAIAKTGEHPLFESRIGFFMSESFFQKFVHDFVLLIRSSAGSAFDEVSVNRAAFVV